MSGVGLRYLTQAAAGQEQLNGRGIAIREVVEHGYLDAHTRSLLAAVPVIKAFGERHGLRPTANYERYLWIGRPAVMWVVSACEPYRFRPKTWSFPVVGSITYTGWFDRDEAERYARSLEGEGWDADVRGSAAYSTLGWFRDPIVSTMLGDEGDVGALGDLADVVLHESLHATFYVTGQSTLNESMASFVGDTLAEQFLAESKGESSEEKTRFVAVRERIDARARRLKQAYEALEKLYDSSVSKDQKLVEKVRIIEQLRLDLRMRRPITNATLIQYKTYGSGRDEMSALYKLCGRSMPRMLARLARVRIIAKAAPPHSDPGELLRPLLAESCP